MNLQLVLSLSMDTLWRGGANSQNFLCASALCSLPSFFLYSSSMHTSNPPLYLIPIQLLNPVKSSFMMYWQPLLNLHFCHHMTDSCSHHLIVRYYENHVKITLPIVCLHCHIFCILLKDQFSKNTAQVTRLR